MASKKKNIATQPPAATPAPEKVYITFGNKLIERPTSFTSTESAKKEPKI